MKNQKPRQGSTINNPLKDYEFEVDPSIKQDLVIKIKKYLPPAMKTPTIGRLNISNPYVIAKKSYGDRRDSRAQRARALEPAPKPISFKRKIIKETQIVPPTRVTPSLNLHLASDIPLPNPKSYFKNTFFTSFLQTPQDRGLTKTFIPIVLSEIRSKNSCVNLQVNDKVVSTIQIVTNENKKISVNIHKALLQANNSAKLNEKHFFEGVANPFNIELRDKIISNLNFMKDYKNGYAPIQLQNMNETETIKVVTDNAKTHFIRKKQSTLSLPRTCGVSYIKPSQSTQGAPFSPLPPLIFQCSSECEEEIAMTPELEELTSKWINCLESCWLVVVECQQEDMRELLLGKTLGKIRFVKGIQNLWLLITERSFLAVSITKPFVDYERIWEEFHSSDIKIGILGKKSTSGKKSFFKSVGLDILEKQPSLQSQTSTCEAKEELIPMEVESGKLPGEADTISLKSVEDISGKECAEYLKEIAKSRSVLTLSIRLEMYVEISRWKNYDKETKNLLNYLTLQIKERLESKSLDIIQRRLNMAKSTDVQSILTKQLVNYRVLITDSPRKHPQPASIHPFNKEVLNQILLTHLTCKEEYQAELIKATKQMPVDEFLNGRALSSLQKAMMLKTPLYYISTRDSFAFDLVQKVDIIQSGTRKYIRTEYFFDPCNVPDNFSKEFRKLFPNFDVGIITYNNFFTDEEMRHFQSKTFETEVKALKNNFLQMTVQPSIVGSKIKRTKFFFGYRYMWTRGQLAEPNSYVGAGVRKDVTPPPTWVKDIQNSLVEHNLVDKGFINSVAINVYHDGKEGLAQHFDDAVRFKQPIYTIRLFSDARLSFGSQLYGFCNSAFVIPLPRGCICVMTEHSYAANGVKHCVRPVDMAGKSAAVILRQMHSLVTTQVDRYDQQVDLPLWVSTLSTSENSTSFAEQKKREADYLLEKKDIKVKHQPIEQTKNMSQMKATPDRQSILPPFTPFSGQKPLTQLPFEIHQ